MAGSILPDQHEKCFQSNKSRSMSSVGLTDWIILGSAINRPSVLRQFRPSAWTRATALLCCTMAWLGTATALESSGGTPIIRVDPGSHSAPALGIRPFGSGDKIVTTSLDKTIRIWRSRDFKLLNTLRIPIDLGLEGRLYFVDVSPDGTRLVAGGHTCFEWEKQACLYVFDPNTGRLLQRVRGLRGTISNLKFSPDGKVIAVGMSEGGIVFLDAHDFSVIGKDYAFGSSVSGLDISPNGYTAVSGLDGYLRVYDSAFKLVARQKVPDLKMIGSTYFSPDGTKLLLGSFETPRFEVLSFPELKQIGFVDLQTQAGNQQTLRNVLWSSSGDYIYGAGDSQDLKKSVIYRWEAKALGEPQAFNVSARRIEGMRAFVHDQLLFSTEDGFVGIADKNGRVAATSQAANMQFPQGSRMFQVSQDGSAVAFPASQDDSVALTFDTRIPDLIDPAPSQARLEPARRQSQKLQLTHWENSSKPLLNGRPLEMQNALEMVRSFAVDSKDQAIVLGTDFALRVYDKSGELLWKNVLSSGSAWNVAVTSNGQLAVATLSDGTIRWYRMSDGEEVLALFIHANQKDWVLWRPDGYYASSENGDNLIGWHVNRGRDTEPDFYRAVQFERQFYRPDLLREQLGSVHVATNNSANPAHKTSQDDVGTRQAIMTAKIVAPDLTQPAIEKFTLSQLNEIAPPRIRVASTRTVQTPEGATELELTVEAEKNSRPMQDVTVYANLLPVATNEERRLDVNETDAFRRTFRFPVNGGDNLIRVEVNNGVSLGLAEQWVEVPAVNQIASLKGDLYVLAVGVNRFDHISSADKNKVPDLKYAVNDAEKLARLLEDSAPDAGFNQVHVQVLSDSAPLMPTRQNILEALKVFEQAGPNDTVLLFLASHGFSDQTGNYYFLPQDGEYNDVESVLSGRNLSGKASTLLSWTDFFDHMRKAAGRRILIVDTCQAKSIFGEFDSRSLRKRSAASLFPLLLASKGDEFSQEYESAQHGLFTHALLEGLRGLADANHDRKVTLAELHDFSVPLVKKLHDPSAGEQTPQLIAPGTLANIELPLAQSK
jgi:WD40 repeat protein